MHLAFETLGRRFAERPERKQDAVERVVKDFAPQVEAKWLSLFDVPSSQLVARNGEIGWVAWGDASSSRARMKPCLDIMHEWIRGVLVPQVREALEVS